MTVSRAGPGTGLLIVVLEVLANGFAGVSAPAAYRPSGSRSGRTARSTSATISAVAFGKS
jgi:hypothetical protein